LLVQVDKNFAKGVLAPDWHLTPACLSKQCGWQASVPSPEGEGMTAGNQFIILLK
jgi:hypothetical protein